MFNVKIKTVDGAVPKGTRSFPFSGLRAKCAPEEICKFNCPLRALKLVTLGGTTQGEENFLSTSLTDWNVINDLLAVFQQLGGLSIFVLIIAPALVTEIGAWISTGTLFREYIDKSNDDYVYNVILAKIAQAFLVGALTLSKELIAVPTIMGKHMQTQ